MRKPKDENSAVALKAVFADSGVFHFFQHLEVLLCFTIISIADISGNVK